MAPPLVELGRLGRVGAPALDGPRRPAPGARRCASASPRSSRPPGTDLPWRSGPRWPRPGVFGRPMATSLALDGVDLSIEAGRGAGAHGAERLGQVHASGHPVGWSGADPGHRAGGRRTTPGSWRRAPSSARWVWSPRTPGSCSTARAWRPSAPRPTRSRIWRRGPRRARSRRVLPDMPADRHPRDLSEGQRLALALAVVLAPAPLAPAAGRADPGSRLSEQGAARRSSCASWPQAGHAVVLATHDVELAARVADRAVVLADGQVIADGPARQVVCHSPVFAPQVAKVLAPDEWLTVEEVRTALDRAVPDVTHVAAHRTLAVLVPGDAPREADRRCSCS